MNLSDLMKNVNSVKQMFFERKLTRLKDSNIEIIKSPTFSNRKLGTWEQQLLAAEEKLRDPLPELKLHRIPSQLPSKSLKYSGNRLKTGVCADSEIQYHLLPRENLDLHSKLENLRIPVFSSITEQNSKENNPQRTLTLKRIGWNTVTTWINKNKKLIKLLLKYHTEHMKFYIRTWRMQNTDILVSLTFRDTISRLINKNLSILFIKHRRDRQRTKQLDRVGIQRAARRLSNCFKPIKLSAFAAWSAFTLARRSTMRTAATALSRTFQTLHSSQLHCVWRKLHLARL